MSATRYNMLTGMLACLLMLGACQTTSTSTKSEEEVTEKPAATSEAAPDPFAVAQSWAEKPRTNGMDAEVKKRAEGWETGRVARIYAASEGYRAVVHPYSTARDAPAILLTIAPNASGQWTVVDAELTRSTHLWPEL